MDNPERQRETDWVAIEASQAWVGPNGYRAFLVELLAAYDTQLRHAEGERAVALLQGKCQLLEEVIRTPEAAAMMLRRNAQDEGRVNHAARAIPRRKRD